MTHIQRVNRHLKFYHVVLFVQFQGPMIYSIQHPVGLLVLKIKKYQWRCKNSFVLHYVSFSMIPKVC